MYCLQACLCIFQPRNFTGWVSEGVNIYALEILFCFEFELLWPQPCLTGKCTVCRHVCASFSLEISQAGLVKGLISMHQKYFFALNLSFFGLSHVCLLFTMKSRKRLAYGVFDHLPPILAFFVTSPTYRLLCSKWQHLWSGFATFKCQSLANRMENLVENCCVSVLYSIPVGMACEACSVWFPFKGTQYGIPKCSVMKQHLCMTDS